MADSDRLDNYITNVLEPFVARGQNIEGFDNLSSCLACWNDSENLEFFLANGKDFEGFDCDMNEVIGTLELLPAHFTPSEKEITGRIKCNEGESLDQINNRRIKLVYVGDMVADASASESGSDEEVSDDAIPCLPDMLVAIPKGAMCYQHLEIDFGWVTYVFTCDALTDGNVN